MKHERTSYAFLMEMIWVCAFFLICAGIFVAAFAKAEQLSRRADVLNQAVQAVSNVMEETFAEFTEDGPGNPLSVSAKYAAEDFSIAVDQSVSDGLLTLTITASDPESGDVLYSLTGSRAVREGGAS